MLTVVVSVGAADWGNGLSSFAWGRKGEGWGVVLTLYLEQTFSCEIICANICEKLQKFVNTFWVENFSCVVICTNICKIFLGLWEHIWGENTKLFVRRKPSAVKWSVQISVKTLNYLWERKPLAVQISVKNIRIFVRKKPLPVKESVQIPVQISKYLWRVNLWLWKSLCRFLPWPLQSLTLFGSPAEAGDGHIFIGICMMVMIMIFIGISRMVMPIRMIVMKNSMLIINTM